MGDSAHLGHQGELRGHGEGLSVLMSDFAAVRPSALVAVAPLRARSSFAMSRARPLKEASLRTLENHLVNDGVFGSRSRKQRFHTDWRDRYRNGDFAKGNR